MRRILSIAWVYQFYQWLVGAHKYVRLFADEYIKYKDGQKILDIGCGPADIIKYLAANVDYTGIDLSPQYINKAQLSFPNQKFICGDIGRADFPLDDNSFDTIFLIGVQHHLTDSVVEMMFDFAHRKLKPGGRMLCLEPVITPRQGLVERMFMRKDRGKYIRTQDAYLSLMKKYFSDVLFEIKPNTMNIPFTIIIMQAVKS